MLMLEENCPAPGRLMCPLASVIVHLLRWDSEIAIILVHHFKTPLETDRIG